MSSKEQLAVAMLTGAAGRHASEQFAPLDEHAAVAELKSIAADPKLQVDAPTILAEAVAFFRVGSLWFRHEAERLLVKAGATEELVVEALAARQRRRSGLSLSAFHNQGGQPGGSSSV